jgi:aminoglycoside phosphotransferase (APT) family kinase protein
MGQDSLLQVLQDNGLLTPESASGSSLKLLTGGFWNKVYRLRSTGMPGLDWVVKQFVQVPVNPMFPILPEAEYAALQFLQNTECAPKPVGFIPVSSAGSLLVYEYIEGTSWDGGLDAAATLLARVHGIPPDAFAIKAFRKIATEPDDLLDHAERMLQVHATAVSDRVRALFPSASSSAGLQSVTPVCRASLVHTDCGPGNMVSSPNGLRLIDWQCPGIGDGLQDVVTFLSPAMQVLYGYPVLSHAQEQQFLKTYFTALDPPEDDALATQTRFVRIRAAHHYRFAAYCAMRLQDTAGSDDKTSQLYSVALQAEMQMLQQLQSKGPGA